MRKNERPNAVQTSTTFPPVASATLLVLARREDGGKGQANGVLTRLLRDELEKIRPGLWDRLLNEEEARLASHPNETAEARHGALAEWLKAEMAGGGR